MGMQRLGRAAGDVVISRATWGGSQNFLGARWVEQVVGSSPVRIRERVALRFLSLSPHYFYDPDLNREDARSRQSRQLLADRLIAPHVTGQSRILDYGCGPGYLAAAVAEKVASVDAVDISRGVLACARVINSRPNITYQTPGQFLAGDAPAQIDVTYSFAVIQHLRPASRIIT
jgi:2-polyprenyl-3-methyl-5-hydroxy-6-metoxy-1,4-benzoquinol methylase